MKQARSSKGVHFHWMYLFMVLLAAVCLANQELLKEAKQYHHRLRTQTELSSDGKSKYCYFGSTASYEVGQTFTPHLLPSGYVMCFTCTCHTDGNVTCRKEEKEKCSKCVDSPLPSSRTDCCKKCLAVRNKGKKRKSCVHEGVTYQHEAVWKISYPYDTSLRANECEECSCINGEVTCAFRICPVANCSKPKAQPGTCCKTCREPPPKPTPVKNRKSGCWSMGRMYNEGDNWHPILSPRDKPRRCVLCTCRSSKIYCRVPSCPKLICAVGVREKNTDCCLKCPESSANEEISPTTAQTLAVTVPAGSVDCVQYNKVYKNGSSFHPDVYPFGVQPCVTCTCQNTVVRCKRVNCTAICQKKGKEESECCKDCRAETMKATTAGFKTLNKRSKRVDCSKNEPISVFKHRRSRRPHRRRHDVETVQVETVAIVDSEQNLVNITTWVNTGNGKIICTKETMRLDLFTDRAKQKVYELMGKISREKLRTFEKLSTELKQCMSGCSGKLRRVMTKIYQLTELPASCPISQEGSFHALNTLKED